MILQTVDWIVRYLCLMDNQVDDKDLRDLSPFLFDLLINMCINYFQLGLYIYSWIYLENIHQRNPDRWIGVKSWSSAFDSLYIVVVLYGNILFIAFSVAFIIWNPDISTYWSFSRLICLTPKCVVCNNFCWYSWLYVDIKHLYFHQ